MPNQIPEISPEEMKNNLQDDESLVILDVGENWEIALARLSHERVVYVPLSLLSRQGLEVLPEAIRLPLESRLEASSQSVGWAGC